MKKEFFILIYCTNSEICRLIIKYLKKSKLPINVNIKCGCLRPGIFDLTIDGKPDCIILGNDVSDEMQERIVSIYSDTKIIFLPSIDNDDVSKETFLISDPLRLSELREVILNLYKEIY